VTALHWLGLFQLLYVFVCALAFSFGLMRDLQDTSGLPPFPLFHATLILMSIFSLFFLALPQAIAGVAAIAGAVTVCKGRRWGRALGWSAIIVSAVYFLMLWCIYLLVLFLSYHPDPDSAPDSLLSISSILFAFYMFVGSILTALAALRCWRRRATEPAVYPAMRWREKAG